MAHLTDNQWGFSVADDNPFAIFPLLQKIALENVGPGKMIDLSRGDPGYGFSPSTVGREFYGYILFLDTYFNNWERRWSTTTADDFEMLWAETEEVTRKHFPHKANQFFAGWKKIFSTFEEIGEYQPLDCSRYAVMSSFFWNGVASGGSYLDPSGQPLFRAAVAHWHKQALDTPIDYQDLLFFNGASHAIGTLFKLLGEEGIGYLKKGDLVMISSPVYSPYNTIINNRGLRTFTFSLDPVTGDMAQRSLEEIEIFDEPVKAILHIDPNNPTGTTAPESVLKKIAAFAERKNCLVITDEVYSSFFPHKKILTDLCGKRVLRINARSKIERSTGLRFGDLLLTKEANRFLTEELLADLMPEGIDFKKLLINSKAPGGIHGEFFHTTFVPGPAQTMGILHILLGHEDRNRSLEVMKKSRDNFYHTLGLPHKGNAYYSIFDLNQIEGTVKQDVPIEQKLVDLAERGVVFIPTYLFFDEVDRNERDLMHTVRISFVNATPERIQVAAEITKKYLSEVS